MPRSFNARSRASLSRFASARCSSPRSHNTAGTWRIAFAVSVVATFLLTLVAERVGKRLQVLDRPRPGEVQKAVVPRTGGYSTYVDVTTPVANLKIRAGKFVTLLGYETINPNWSNSYGVGSLYSHSFLFGFAKPVPTNASRMRSPRRDMVLVALAGPGMNIALAVISALLLEVLWRWYRSGELSDAALETAAFTIFLYARMLRCSAARPRSTTTSIAAGIWIPAHRPRSAVSWPDRSVEGKHR